MDKVMYNAEDIAADLRVPLNEKRLLSLEDFCEYAGGIGKCTARKFVRKIGVEVWIGGRCLVDRVKFDRWCDEGAERSDCRVFHGLRLKKALLGKLEGIRGRMVINGGSRYAAT